MKPAEIKILDEINHALLRPEIWVGSTQSVTKSHWVVDQEKICKKEIEFVPAILKLIDEVLTNSIDEALKTNFKFSNKIMIDVDVDGTITIADNGRGLSIEWDEENKEYSAALAFLKLRAGSNFIDSENNVSIGRFGVGVSLTNIFSKYFEVKTTNTEGKSMHLICQNNSREYIAKVRKVSGPSGTMIKWKIDFEYFKINGIDETMLGLLKKRIYDLAMIFPEIKFKFNGITIRTSLFKEYVKCFNKPYVIFESGDFKFAVMPSEEYSFLSFVNGVETFRGGTHIDGIVWALVKELQIKIQKKCKIKEVKPKDISDKLLFVVSARNVQNPKFDSQTKEKLINQWGEISKYFSLNGSVTTIVDKIVSYPEILDPIVETYLLKQQKKDLEEVKQKNKNIHSRKKIAKLIDAQSNEKNKCVLFLTEGDSAGGTALEVRNKQYHAFLPLRGKVLNVLNCKDKEVLDNQEIQSIMGCIGLRLREKAIDLNYGKIVLLTDADPDGNCITALLINFFYKYWPELFEQKIICKYKSPIIIAEKKGDIRKYYTIEEFNQDQKNLKDYKISYNKGLGGLDKEEYRKMLNDPIIDTYCFDDKGKLSIETIFGYDSQLRKTWLS